MAPALTDVGGNPGRLRPIGEHRQYRPKNASAVHRKGGDQVEQDKDKIDGGEARQELL